MKTKTAIFVVLALAAVSLLLAQAAGPSSATVSAAMTGTGQTINGTITIPLAPGTLTFSCSPSVLQKGSSAACTAALDQPVPAGMTGTVTLTVACPTGTTCTVAPASITIPAGSATCGTTAAPCFTVSRQ